MYLVQATINVSRFVTKINFASTTLVQLGCISVDSLTTTLARLRTRDAVQSHQVVLILYVPLHSSEMNVSKLGRMMRETNSLDLVYLRFLFKLNMDRFG